MNIVYLLLPLALLLAATFVGAYVWCASRGQFDDLETPAHRILLDEDNDHEIPHHRFSRPEEYRQRYREGEAENEREPHE